MYSMSKIFTVVSALQLIEQNKLHLEDKVEKFFPCFKETYFKKKGKIYKNPTAITVKPLLTMTSGFNYEIQTNSIKQVKLEKGENGELKDFIPAFTKEPLAFETGKSFEYGLSHDVLVGVVEIVSEMPFDEYVKKNLFIPLEMYTATFANDFENAYPKYVCNPDLRVVPMAKDNSLVFTPKYISGGAGLVCTVREHAKLVKALTKYGIAENGNRILKKETIEKND